MENQQKEIWKDVIGYEGAYKVSSSGIVKCMRRKVNAGNKGGVRIVESKILKAHITRFGYKRVELNLKCKGKKFHIHRIVAIAFLCNKENKEEVNHKDGNKLNNHVSNLEWSTPKENIRHAFKNKLINVAKGENHVCAKLTKKQVIEIIDKFHSGEYKSFTATGRIYGVSHRSIEAIVKGINWKHVPRPYSNWPLIRKLKSINSI